jgi:hypothetical protein
MICHCLLSAIPHTTIITWRSVVAYKLIYSKVDTGNLSLTLYGYMFVLVYTQLYLTA